MSQQSNSIAELAAMRARGELTAEQFEAARKLLNPETVPQPSTKSYEVRQGVDNAPQLGTKPADKSESKRLFWIIVFIIGSLVAIGMFSGANKTPEQKAMEAAQAAVDAAKKSNEEADRKRKGFHCLSGWNGSHRALADAVKNTMRDPDSFEVSETRISPEDTAGRHTVLMEFRAKNGFGGTNVGIATGTIRNGDCSLIDWNLLKN